MKKLVTIVFLISLLSYSIEVQSQAVINKIIKEGKIKVGLTGTQPPFSVEAKDGTVIGYEVDLAIQLAKSLSVEVDFVRMPFSDLLNALEKGKVDIIMSGMTITVQRNLRVAFKGPYMVSGKSILTKSSVLKTVTSASELNNDWVKLATLKGSTSEDFAKANIPQAKIILIDNYDEGVQMVREGKIDALLADFSICAYSILKYPNEGLLTLNTPLTIEPIGIALPPNDPLLMNLVENFFKVMQLNGGLEKLQEKWFRSGVWLDQVK